MSTQLGAYCRVFVIVAVMFFKSTSPPLKLFLSVVRISLDTDTYPVADARHARALLLLLLLEKKLTSVDMNACVD